MTGARWNALRVAFVVAVVASAWWSWHDSGEELVTGMRDLPPGAVAGAAVLVIVGLATTGAVWRVALGSFGVTGTARDVVPPFFVAQLGKYVPGSVWAFAAQGALGARRGLPPRVPASASVLFLGVHVASGALLTGVVGWWTSLPWWVMTGSLVVGLVGLAPPVHRLLGSRLAGEACAWDLGRSLRGLLLMTVVWTTYALALTVLAPDPDVPTALALGCAFAVSHAVGVAVPVAPAGLGARDGMLVLLVAPVVGAGPAGAIAVVARLLHTIADFLVAAVSWSLLGSSDERRGGAAGRGDH